MQRLQPSTREEMKVRAGHRRAPARGGARATPPQRALSGAPLRSPTDRSLPGSSGHGILQARILVGCCALFQGIFPGTEPMFPMARKFFTTSATWKIFSISHCVMLLDSVSYFPKPYKTGHFPPGLPPGRYVKLHRFRAKKALTTLPSSGFVLRLCFGTSPVSHMVEREEQSSRKAQALESA